jgi:hypothetical protein
LVLQLVLVNYLVVIITTQAVAVLEAILDQQVLVD